MISKKSMGTATLIAAVIGAIILLLFIGGPLQATYKLTRDQIFPKVVPPKQANESQFVPYAPTLSEAEQNILNSMNAMVCAANSLAVGKFDYANNDVCPKENRKNTSQPVTVTYGSATVKCDGFDISKLILSANKIDAAFEMASIISTCYAYLIDNTDRVGSEVKDIICAYVDSSKLPSDVILTEGDIETPLADMPYGGKLLGNDAFLVTIANNFEMDDLTSQSKNKCVSFSNSGATWSSIYIQDCPTKAMAISNEISPFACQLSGINFPQKLGTTEAYWDAITGAGDPAWLAFYEEFPETESIYWQGPQISQYFINVGLAVVTSYFFSGGGKLVKDIGYAGFVKEIVGPGLKNFLRNVAVKIGQKMVTKRGIEVATKSTLFKNILSGVKGLTIDEIDALTLKYDEAVAKGLAKDWTPNAAADAAATEFKTDILPTFIKVKSGQKIMTLTGIDFGKRVVIFETMSEAETKAAAELLEQEIKSAFKESVEQSPKLIFEAALKDVPGLVKTQSDDLLVKYNGLVDDYLAKGYSSQDAAKYAEQEFNEKILPDFFGKNLFKQSEKEAIESGLKDALKRGISDDAFKKVAMHSFLNSFFKQGAKEGTQELDEALLKKTFTESKKLVDGLLKLDPAKQAKIMEKVEQDILKLFDSDMVFKGFSGEIDKEIVGEVLERTFDDATQSSVFKLLSSGGRMMDDWLKLGKFTTEEVNILKQIIPENGWLQGPVLPIALHWKNWKTLGLAGPTGQVKQLSSFLWGKRYTALVGLYLYQQYTEGINEKRSPQGVNSLVLHAPSLYNEEQERVFELNNKTISQYITLFNKYRENKQSTRFNLVSPCTTNLVMRRTYCKCPRNPTNSHFNFGGGPIDVKTQSITFKKEPNLVINGQIIENYAAIAAITETLGGDANTPGLRAASLNFPIILPDKSAKETLNDYVDISNAVKVCDDLGLIEQVKSGWDWWSGLVNIPLISGREYGKDLADARTKWGTWTTECIVVQSDPTPYDSIVGYNYCYPRYPWSDATKKYLGRITTAIDISLTAAALIFTGGTALPVVAPFIVAINTADALIETAITENWQKWPLHER